MHNLAIHWDLWSVRYNLLAEYTGYFTSMIQNLIWTSTRPSVPIKLQHVSTFVTSMEAYHLGCIPRQILSSGKVTKRVTTCRTILNACFSSIGTNKSRYIRNYRPSILAEKSCWSHWTNYQQESAPFDIPIASQSKSNRCIRRPAGSADFVWLKSY